MRGIGSRRACDALIQSGAVRVNGVVVDEPGRRVEPERDQVQVRGKPLPGRSALRYYMIHKPVGMITTLSDPEGRRTVRELLPPGPRLFPVGRLDADTSGLLLVTNDGELAHKLMHPRYGVDKRYRVLLDRLPSSEQMARLRSGVMLDPGERSAPAEVRISKAHPHRPTVDFRIHEGRYRQVRRMCEAVGLAVKALHRYGYGPLRLDKLPRGMVRPLTTVEVRRLRTTSARPEGVGPRRPGGTERPAKQEWVKAEKARRRKHAPSSAASPGRTAEIHDRPARPPRPARAGSGGFGKASGAPPRPPRPPRSRGERPFVGVGGRPPGSPRPAAGGRFGESGPSRSPRPERSGRFGKPASAPTRSPRPGRSGRFGTPAGAPSRSPRPERSGRFGTPTGAPSRSPRPGRSGRFGKPAGAPSRSPRPERSGRFGKPAAASSRSPRSQSGARFGKPGVSPPRSRPQGSGRFARPGGAPPRSQRPRPGAPWRGEPTGSPRPARRGGVGQRASRPGARPSRRKGPRPSRPPGRGGRGPR